ncbi:MAG: hypothetical protein LBJ74_00690 [Heliobacteriaceae bacterium]|jgi:hypothetical protein|nr:hypothetical protein [Heliobacteriaceae bacterium]
MTSIKANIGKYALKGLGLAALGMVAYDSHVIGKLSADTFASSKDADAMTRRATNTLFLSNPSVIDAKIKEAALRFETEDNTRHFVNSGVGYFKGFLSTMVSEVVPLGLGVGAFWGNKFIRIASSIGLGLYGVTKFFKDFVGWGHSRDLNSAIK